MAFVARNCVVVESPRAVARSSARRGIPSARRFFASAARSNGFPDGVSASRSRRGREGVSRPALADRLGQKTEEARPADAVVPPLPSKETAESIIEGDACPVNKDFVWQTLCKEAREEAQYEPALASYLFSTILSHRSLEDALAFVLANKLASNVLLDSQLLEMFSAQYRRDEMLVKRAQADMQAVMDRDPACEEYTQILLFFKGFQAVQAYRVANALWLDDRKPLALLLQSRISEIFHVDIHPGATIGEGVMLDHATGVVIGETAVVGDNVSILHGVTLGGTGVKDGDRHPKIGNGVVIGAGVTILGNIRVGANSKIGAGSVVLKEIPENCTAVGIPARLVGGPKPSAEPSLDMDQVSGLADYVYNI